MSKHKMRGLTTSSVCNLLEHPQALPLIAVPLHLLGMPMKLAYRTLLTTLLIRTNVLHQCHRKFNISNARSVAWIIAGQSGITKEMMEISIARMGI